MENFTSEYPNNNQQDISTAQSYCRGVGGMHYITFDGLQYTFAGGCRYQLAVTTFDPLLMVGKNVQPFNITVGFKVFF